MTGLLAVAAALATLVAGAGRDTTCTGEVTAPLGGSLYPSHALATAGIPLGGDAAGGVLGDRQGQIALRLSCDLEASATPFEVAVEIPGLAEPSTHRGTVPAGCCSGPGCRCTLVVQPVIRWRREVLLGLRSPGAAMVDVRLALGSEDQHFSPYQVERWSQRLVVHGVNDCPFLVPSGHSRDGRPFGRDLSWMFAAYVNENHPFVRATVLPEARTLGIVGEFTGYQLLARDPHTVHRQLFAIWATLQRRGFHYAGIATPTMGSSDVAAQYVRFLSDSLAAAEANCIDGTVLLAAILRGAELRPYLVLVPGHAFVCLEMEPDRRSVACLETTELGVRDVPVEALAPELRALLPALRPAGRADLDGTLRSFLHALQTGTGRLRRALGAARPQAHISLSDFPFQASRDLVLLDLAEARSMGILPIDR